jgi:hypothetical protein
MKTFLVAHGAWSAGWVDAHKLFDRLARLLGLLKPEKND